MPDLCCLSHPASDISRLSEKPFGGRNAEGGRDGAVQRLLSTERMEFRVPHLPEIKIGYINKDILRIISEITFF